VGFNPNPWGFPPAQDLLEFDFPEFAPNGPITIDVPLSMFPPNSDAVYMKELDILRFLAWLVRYSFFLKIFPLNVTS
jgi:hypothetical protein